MTSTRPVTGLDHLGKDVLIHVGLVFAGHLDVPRLRKSASEIISTFPELDIVVKRKWYPVCFPPDPLEIINFHVQYLQSHLLSGISSYMGAFSSTASGIPCRRPARPGTSSIASCPKAR
jgi:hypothetical protein